MNESIGNRISRLRKEKNLTQEQLAQMLDVSPQAVSKWENDLTCPDISLLSSISDCFNITVDELLKGKTEAVTGFSEQNCDQVNTKKENLRVIVTQPDGRKTNVSVPIKVAKTAIKLGGNVIKSVAGTAAQGIDAGIIISAIENGAAGKIADVVTENHEHIEVYIE